MNRELFEQLVNDWLDDPADDELRRQVAAALQSSPELGIESERAITIERLLRAAHNRDVRGVDWMKLRQRIAGELRAAAADGGAQAVSPGPPAPPATRLVTPETDRADARLDAQLSDLSGLEVRVDWDRLRERVAANVRAEARRLGAGRLRRRPDSPTARWLLRTAVGLGLAAAALIVVSVLPRLQPRPPRGFSSVTVVSAGQEQSPGGGAGAVREPSPRAFATVRVSGPADATETVAPIEPEFYLFIGPVDARDASTSSGRGVSAAGV